MTRTPVVLFKDLKTGNSSVTAIANESEGRPFVDLHFDYNGDKSVVSLYLDDLMKNSRGIANVLRFHWKIPLWEARQIADKLDEDGWVSVWTVMES